MSWSRFTKAISITTQSKYPDAPVLFLGRPQGTWRESSQPMATYLPWQVVLKAKAQAAFAVGQIAAPLDFDPLTYIRSDELRDMAASTRLVPQEEDDDDQQDTVVVALEKEQSAIIIQGYYRRYRRRRDAGSGWPHYVEYNRQATNLLERAPLGSKPTTYAACLRGPMPHVANYMNRVISQCQHIIEVLQTTMLTIDHGRLDDVMLERQQAL